MKLTLSITALLLSPLFGGTQAPSSAMPDPVTLREAKLTPQVKKEIVAHLVNSMAAQGGDLSEIALDSNLVFLNLGSTGHLVMEVEEPDSQCAPNGSGNCPFVVFQQIDGHAALILEGSGQNLKILKSAHHGMLDLSWGQKMGHTTEFDIEVARFNGKAYAQAFCYSETTDDNGHTKATPHHAC